MHEPIISFAYYRCCARLLNIKLEQNPSRAVLVMSSYKVSWGQWSILWMLRPLLSFRPISTYLAKKKIQNTYPLYFYSCRLTTDILFSLDQREAHALIKKRLCLAWLAWVWRLDKTHPLESSILLFCYLCRILWCSIILAWWSPKIWMKICNTCFTVYKNFSCLAWKVHKQTSYPI